MDDRYKNPDNDPRGPWTSSDLTARTYSAIVIILSLRQVVVLLVLLQVEVGLWIELGLRNSLQIIEYGLARMEAMCPVRRHSLVRCKVA